MSLVTSTAACNAATNAVTALLGSGAKLKFRLSGTLSSPGTAVASLSLSSTPFASAVGGVAEANTITADSSATGNASPVATATLETSGGTVVIHCSVAADVGGDINLTNGLTIAPGDVVTCTRLRYAALVDKTTSMAFAANMQKQLYYSGPIVFANLMHGTGAWQDTGAGYDFWYPQNLSVISGATGTTVNNLVLAAPENALPAGTYTVRNPGGFPLCFGTAAGVQDLDTSVGAGAGVFITNTSFTLTLAANSGLSIFVKGNTPTTSGKLEVIIPGHVTSYDAGDLFNSAWVSFQQGLGTQAIRVMDWCSTNDNIIEDWADRPTMAGHGFQNRITGSSNGFGYPYEVAIAAANRLNLPLYVNIPSRATDAFVTSLFSLISSTYTAPKPVYVEYANETWNTQGVTFLSQSNYVTYLTFTKNLVTVSGSTFTKTAHGYTDSQVLRPFEAPYDRLNSPIESGGNFWLAKLGQPLYVKVLTANTFQLWDIAITTGTLVTAGTGATKCYIVDPAEAGKTADLDLNHGTRSKAIWDIADAALGSSRVKAVMGSFQGSALGAMTTARMSAPGAGARTDHVCIAPYFYGYTMGGAIDRASTQFTPKFYTAAGMFGNGETTTVYFRVYAAGSTPRVDQIKAGTGTGYVGGNSFSATYSAGAYTSGAAVTGLSNGTTYKVYFCAVEATGNTWTWSQDVAASASSDTVSVPDTFKNQTLRTLYDMDKGESSAATKIAAHKTAAQAINPATTVICYEGGNHQSDTRPAAVDTWWESWVEDASYAELFRHYLYELAAADCKMFFTYYDSGIAGPWTLADNSYDTADLRYQAVGRFKGYVPKYTQVSYSTINAGDITAAPGAFPYTVYTFSETNRTFEIVSGDDEGNYRMSGLVLQMVATTNINFATSAVKTLKMRATDGFTESFFNLSINLGVAPLYESDALIAWDKFSDSNTTQINPVVGNALSENGGSSTVATIDGSGWWDMNGVSGYGNFTGMTASTPTNASVPFGLLWVGKKDNDTATAGNHILFFSNNNLGFGAGAGGFLKYVFWDQVSVEVSALVDWSDGNPVVAWMYFDGAGLMYWGKNQSYLTGYSSGVAVPSTLATTLNREIQVYQTTVKHGAFELVSRAGMTRANWLAIVQKYQTAFSIP